MSLALAAVLVIGGLIGAAALAIGVPLFFGMMAFDVAKSPRKPAVAEGDAHVRIALERGVARAFVLGGGIFWSIAAFAGLYSFRETGATAALIAAFIPLAVCIATLIVGWFYERATAILLAAAAIGVVAWGVIFQFEVGVWVLMGFALLGPALTASLLFWLARRDQEAYELATLSRPQLALVFDARSSIAA